MPLKEKVGKTYIFFDLTDYSLMRFPEWISSEILLLNENANFLFCYLYEYPEETDLSDLKSRGEIIPLHGDIKNIDSVLKQYIDNSIVFTFAVRPPEFYISARAREMGIQSRLVQHGIFIPFMKKEASYFLGEAKKLFYYAKSVYSLAKITHLSKIQLAKDVFEVYIRGKKRVASSVFVELGEVADEVYVYSSYWADYFERNYGCSKSRCIDVGAPDLIGFDECFDEPLEDAVCYVCQTLVEDGRLSATVLEEFVDTLYRSLNSEKVLYIKLHPRSNVALYKPLIDRKNTIICSAEMPYCEKYVGHYSTLLVRSMFVSGDVFLWEFEGHSTPEYFKETASDVESSSERLLAFLSRDSEIKPKVELLSHYFGTPGRVPFKEIAIRNV